MRSYLLIIALTGCVSANQAIGGTRPIVESTTVRVYMNESALTAINMMRPRWLENDPRIIVDGVPTMRSTLETLHANEIREVKYMHAIDDDRATLYIITW